MASSARNTGFPDRSDAAGTQRPLYRPVAPGDDAAVTRMQTVKLGNLMHDPRVRRGLSTGPAASALSHTKISTKTLKTTQTPGRGKTSSELISSGFLPLNARSSGPGPFEARAPPRPFDPLDLSAHLVEAEAKRETRHQLTQTDDFAAAEEERPYRQPKTGVDAGTQVPHGSKARLTSRLTASKDVILFDFDKEVAPIVDTIVQKIVEQSVFELSHESQLTNLHTRRVTAVQAKQADMAAEQALQTKVMQAAERKTAVVDATRQETALMEAAMRKVTCSAMARSMIRTSLGTAMQELSRKGYWMDSLRAEITSSVLPELFAGVAIAMERQSVATASVEAIVAESLQRGGFLYQERLRLEEEERRRPVMLTLRLELPVSIAQMAFYAKERDGDEDEAPSAGVTIAVGPIPVTRYDIVSVVEAKIPDAIKALNAPLPGTAIIAALEQLCKGKRLRLLGAGRSLSADKPLLSYSAEMLAALTLEPEGGFPPADPETEAAE